MAKDWKAWRHAIISTPKLEEISGKLVTKYKKVTCSKIYWNKKNSNEKFYQSNYTFCFY